MANPVIGKVLFDPPSSQMILLQNAFEEVYDTLHKFHLAHVALEKSHSFSAALSEYRVFKKEVLQQLFHLQSAVGVAQHCAEIHSTIPHLLLKDPKIAYGSIRYLTGRYRHQIGRFYKVVVGVKKEKIGWKRNIKEIFSTSAKVNLGPMEEDTPQAFIFSQEGTQAIIQFFEKLDCIAETCTVLADYYSSATECWDDLDEDILDSMSLPSHVEVRATTKLWEEHNKMLWGMVEQLYSAACDPERFSHPFSPSHNRPFWKVPKKNAELWQQYTCVGYSWL